MTEAGSSPQATLPVWAAGACTAEEWKSIPASLQGALREVAALKYNPGLISSVSPRIDAFKKTVVGSLEERVYLAAFRAMFAKEKEYKAFQKEKLGR